MLIETEVYNLQQIGKLTVITGPMYSGKTTELLNFAEIYELGRKKIKIFKPQIDVRYSADDVVTHKLFKMPATVVKNLDEMETIYKNLDEKPDAIFIDEVHFFENDITYLVKDMTADGVDVYCAGLDLNYLWQPFPTTASLMALADEVIKKKAVCEICGEYTGTLSYKKKIDGGIIDVGGKEKYIAVCKDCYKKLVDEEVRT
ncbi:MAG TPA: thymidine kinase [Fervidobacterium sp.]|jgi:thymidine kinase|nr:thymidine kinase [Fervidobacterium sp.]HCL98309.1 thymidine kinase [Fervidobacterium sp.]HUM75240.1 thymidine kinase [Fervidobacterium sp.]